MSEATLLDTIVARRREDVRAARQSLPFVKLQEKLRAAPPAIDFTARLRAAAPMALIAEIKRSSPSKGEIAADIDAAKQALAYARGGAAAVSVLTEPVWFRGSLDDLEAVRAAMDGLGAGRPAVLRKDFIVDEYQVVEGRASGADSILLIVAALSDGEMAGLVECSRAMAMEPLVEVSNATEMERAVGAGAKVIGINNRDLRDFKVDLGTTDRLAGMAPAEVLLVALSGITSRADVERFAVAGASAVLVGEALMQAGDPGVLIRELVGP